MKRAQFITMALYVVFVSLLAGCKDTSTPPSPSSRTVDAIISTQWLEDSMNNRDMVILDVRESHLYSAGHIAGSINVPAFDNFFLCLLDPDCGLWMEVPPDDSLFAAIGDAGVNANSTVVIVGRAVDSQTLGPGEFGVTMAARAAITLIYAGIENVAMLDGGYDKWAAEGRITSTDPYTPTASAYSGTTRKATFVLKDYVERKIGKCTLVDTREADTYFGIKTDRSSVRAGHIPTAKVLPAPWFWTDSKDEDGDASCLMWKDTASMAEIAHTVLGNDMGEEIIVYCGVGGYASPVYYVLTEVIGYTNVKFYDGSMQEWTADPEAAVAKYKYE